MTLLPIIAGLLGLGTVLAAVPLVLSFCRRARNFNRDRDLHHGEGAAVPRLGGLALAAAFLVVSLFAGIVSSGQTSSLLLHPAIILSCVAMFALGFIDDLKPLGARKKLAGQILIALAVWAFGFGIQTFKVPFTGHIVQFGPWSAAITVLWLVSMTNLINLVDGIDGLAGGISFMLMVLLGYVGHQTGNLELIIAGMGGALLGFLRFNFPPARIYMGDGGAYFLGFQIGLFAIVGSHKGEVLAALTAPLFVLALPILDTSLAILRRGLRGLPLFRPDRRHLHHHLLETGMSHRKVVLAFYAVSIVFLVMGMVAYWSRGQLIPVLFGLVVLTLLVCAGQFRFSRRWFAIGRMVENSLNMRREIEYAMCLSKSLALEGRRQQGVENLWQTLAGIADKLGFVSVKLTLADGERHWVKQPRMDANGREWEEQENHLTAKNAEVGRVAPRAPGSAPVSPRERARVRGKEMSNSRNGQNPNDFSPLEEDIDRSADWQSAVSRIGNPPPSPALRSFRINLLDGRCGVLELNAPCDQNADHQSQPGSRQRNWARPTITDIGLCETISELVAEGWVKAARNYINGDNQPLRFAQADSAHGQSDGQPRSACARPMGDVQPCEGGGWRMDETQRERPMGEVQPRMDAKATEQPNHIAAKNAKNAEVGRGSRRAFPSEFPTQRPQRQDVHRTPEDKGTITHPLSPRERGRVRGKETINPHDPEHNTSASPLEHAAFHSDPLSPRERAREVGRVAPRAPRSAQNGQATNDAETTPTPAQLPGEWTPVPSPFMKPVQSNSILDICTAQRQLPGNYSDKLEAGI